MSHWRIAPCGTREVFVTHLSALTARVHNRVGRRGWAKQPMHIARADLFETRAEALAEYRRRRQAALAVDPACSLNLTTDLEGS
jgi:hypothetical protein